MSYDGFLLNVSGTEVPLLPSRPGAGPSDTDPRPPQATGETDAAQRPQTRATVGLGASPALSGQGPREELPSATPADSPASGRPPNRASAA